MSKKRAAAGLQTRGAVALWATILICSLFFFLLGVYVGNRLSRGQEQNQSPDVPAKSIEDPRAELDFYEELARPAADSGKTGKASSKSPEVIVEPALPPPGSDSPTRPAASARVDAPASTPPPAGVERYTVQVAALKQLSEARQVMIRLEARGYAPILVQPSPADPEFYRVWVGFFQDPAEAARLEAKLKTDDFPTYIKKVEASRISR